MRLAGTVLLMLIFATGLLDTVNGKTKISGDCKTVKNGNCAKDYKEIYKEQYMGYGDETVTEKKCCTKDSGKEKREEIAARGCIVTKCLNPKTSSAKGKDLCAELNKRWVKGEQLDYEEAVRNSCSKGDNRIGVEALCCPKNSKEGMLTLLLGAEKHQFPHYALIRVTHDNSVGTCGGTIYNERYIITASHCILNKGKMRPTEGSQVLLDVWINTSDNPHSYDVEKFIAHPNSTKWNPQYKGDSYNDVGLIKLKKKIKFGPNIKALPIAKTGFNPFKYSNEAVLIGVGQTDTTLGANMLQRVRTLLRSDSKNMHSHYGFTMAMADEILFLGGIQDGITSPRSGQGDSGGPAICRDEKGYALMCGVVSSGPALEDCEKKLDEHACHPQLYMEAQHFYEWFVSEAGEQKDEYVLKAPLFGAPVSAGNHEHQVHITTKDGFSCGGTLIEKDIVVTAAHCVVEDDGTNKKDVKVFTGVRDLNSDKGKELGVSEIQVLDGFQKGNQGNRERRIARLNVKPTPKYPFYKNDLALLKLSSKADISSKKLPKIGPAPESGDDADDVIWTTEVSYPTDVSRSGSLQQRDFHILEHRTCQNRMNRASYAGYDVRVDDNILCGEEMYAGGAQCDRELGGGLICKGKDGNDVLCGVQVFRFCQLALPSAFLDINQYTDWVQQTKSKM